MYDARFLLVPSHVCASQFGLYLNMSQVSVVYARYADHLKVYTRYINNYDRACDTVASLKQNKEFQKVNAYSPLFR